MTPNFENTHKLYEQGKKTSLNSNTNTKGMKVMKSIVDIIQPIVEQHLEMKFPKPISDSIMLSPPVTVKELQSKNIKVMQECRKKKINESFTDGGSECDSLTVEQLTSRYIRIGQKPPAETFSNKIEHLKRIERTEKVKLWPKTIPLYVSTSLTWLYDPANYFTDIEYIKKYQDCKLINVQDLVEKPKLYTLSANQVAVP
ncbi:unnamed protein product [Mytilus coruscus]|uniref:Uncharacterized protein n=1 Tax=Mytilus coruscus TaxID=42192 RepID=A0A6J8CIB5_MYTCO|nr:unnamed protein product [Mytilus coruscus]